MRLSFSDRLLMVSDIILDDRALELIPQQFQENARQNFSNIEAVEFEYISNGKKYSGFYARLKDLSLTEKHPVIILNRGGSGRFGVVDAKQIFFGFATSVIKAGYIVIGSQCMGLSDDGASDEMCGEDFNSVLTLKEYIDADDMADENRIGVYCSSRGAIATFRLLAETHYIKAAVIISGMIDCLDDSFRPEMAGNYVKMFGGSVKEREKRSVICWPEKLSKNAPILLMYGTSDWRVDPRSVLRLSEKFLDLKIPHRLTMFEGNDHGLMESFRESRAMGLSWLDRFVRNDETLPNMECHGK